uniref:Uncharacterized protein n=1 Tax=Steinernema glaseri TaxID=37863 RepID=A0A1I7ZCR5_9BILA
MFSGEPDPPSRRAHTFAGRVSIGLLRFAALRATSSPRLADPKDFLAPSTSSPDVPSAYSPKSEPCTPPTVSAGSSRR